MEELSTTLLVFRDNVKVIVIKPTGLLGSCPNVSLYRDGYIHTSLIEAVEFCFEQGAEGVLIDLSETPCIADGGESQLIMASKIAGGYNRKVFLCSLNELSRSCVEIFNLDRVFQIFADRETFIQYFNETLKETINTKNQEVIENKSQEVIEHKSQEVIENTEKQNQPMNCPLGLECIENQNGDCKNSSYCRAISSPINLPLVRVNDNSFLSGGYWFVKFPELSNPLNYHQLTSALYRDLHEVGYYQPMLVFRKNLKILIVEVDEYGRDMLERRLYRKGHEVWRAVDGVEGLELARYIIPDLILMDLSLPVMDGWEAIRQIKADPIIKAIPVIALTAPAMAGDHEKFLAAGFDDYDTKPVEFSRLWEKIQGCLNKATAPS